MADDYENLEAVLVDPYFDVFRQLDREETPPIVKHYLAPSRAGR